jgi:hypothetical protein
MLRQSVSDVQSKIKTLFMSSSIRELLIDWYCRSKFSQYAHYESAKFYEALNYWLGIPVILLSAVVGTSVFATLGQSINPAIQILIGLLSISTAALASLQTFLKFSEKAESCKFSGANYGALRREVQEMLVFNDFDRKHIASVRKRMNDLAGKSPHIPNKIWLERGKKLVKYREDANEQFHHE